MNKHSDVIRVEDNISESEITFKHCLAFQLKSLKILYFTKANVNLPTYCNGKYELPENLFCMLCYINHSKLKGYFIK